jgi:hypothetical protein
LLVGAAEGRDVGLDVGLLVGAAEGRDVGLDVGLLVGAAEGRDVGLDVGLLVGADEGDDVGIDVGLPVGAAVGKDVGLDVGLPVGCTIVPGEPISVFPGIGLADSKAPFTPTALKVEMVVPSRPAELSKVGKTGGPSEAPKVTLAFLDPVESKRFT